MKLLADSSLSNEDAALNSNLAKKAAVSKARFPVDYTMSRAIKQYKLV
jgi:hypothetical protein